MHFESRAAEHKDSIGGYHGINALVQRSAMYITAMLLLAIPSFGAHAADLMDVYWQALGNDPTYTAAHQSLKIAQEKSNQALAGNLPTISLTGNDSYTDLTSSINRQPPSNRGINNWSWNLQLTQPLMRPQNLLAYNESQQMEEAARQEFRQAEQNLILRVAQAYFELLVSQENVASAQAQLAALLEQEKVARRGYELGAKSVVDSAEAKSKAEQARAQLIISQNDLENKRAELEQLVGKQYDSYAPLKASIPLPHPVPMNIQAWVDQAKESNPAVLNQMFSLRATQFGVDKARSEHLWTIDLVASYGTNYASGTPTIPPPYETRGRSSMAGIQVNIPIFSGGLNSSHVREAIANHEKQAALLEESKRKAGAEAKKSYVGILNGLAQIEALQASVAAGESSVKGNLAGYKVGLRINSDVLNAQQQLFAARHDLIKARYTVLLEGLKLKAAAGILTVHDLESINGLLEH